MNPTQKSATYGPVTPRGKLGSTSIFARSVVLSGCLLAALLGVSPGAIAADFYWSGAGASSDNIDQGDNWFGGVNPSSGDNLYFNNTSGSRHGPYCNYGAGAYFGYLISYNGAGGINWRGDQTYLYKFENNNDGTLLQAEATLANRTGPDTDLEINPVGSGGIAVSNVVMQNGKQLLVYGGNTLNVRGNVSQSGAGNASLALMQGARGILRGSNTFAGGIFVKSGILEQNGAAFALGTGTLNLGDTSGANNSALNPSGTGFTATNPIVVTAGNTGLASITNGAGSSFVYSGPFNLNKPLRLVQNGSGSVRLAGPFLGGSGVLTVTNTGTGTGTMTVGGLITNVPGATLNFVQDSATSILSLSPAVVTPVNTFTGAVVIKAGRLLASRSGGVDGNYGNHFGSVSNLVTFGTADNSATVLELGYRSSIANPVNVVGTGLHTMVFSHNNAGQIHLVSGPITLNANDLILSVANVGSASGTRIQGGITGTGSIIVSNLNTSGNGVDFRTVSVNNTGTIRNDSTGAGTVSMGSASVFGANVTSLIQNSVTSPWNMSQANGSFVGTAQVLAGTMRLQNTGSLNVNNAASVASGALLEITNIASQTIAGLNDVSGSGGTVSNTTSVVQTHTLTLGGSGTYSFGGVIGATIPANLAVTKSGTGTQTLSGNNTYGGATAITGGTLKIGHANALGTTAGTTTINSGGTLDLNGQSIAETLSVSGAGVSSAGALINNSGTAAAVNSDIVNGAGYSVGGSGDIALQRSRSGGSPFTVTKEGAGTLTLGTGATANHNNLLALVINNGTVVLNMPGFLAVDRDPVQVNTGLLRLSGTGGNQITDDRTLTLAGGSFDLNGKSEAIGYLIGAGGNVISNGAASTTSTLTVGGGFSSTGTGTNAGSIQDGAGIVALTKNGTGTMTLTGANTYTGNTTISGGTLLVNGSLASGSAVSVASGATLGGSGTIGGAITVNAGGVLAAGASIGTLTNSSAPTLNGIILAEINRNGGSPLADKIVFNGGAALGGTLTVSNIGAAAVNGDTFDLFDGAVTGVFATLSLPAGGAAHWKTNNLVVDGSITFSNASPVAKDLTAGVVHGGTVVLPVIGGKNGAVDADGDALNVTAVGAPTSGSVTTNATSVIYTASGSTGTNTFTYTVADAFGATDTKTVTVVVTDPQGFNKVSAGVDGGNAVLTYLGIPGTNYALDVTHDLPATNWIPVISNTASGIGYLYFTNPISLAPTNDYYRTRYVP